MKPSILVVDDDPAMVRTLCDIFTLSLNLAGYCGLSMQSGFTATGLPIGVQFYADLFKDSLLTRVAAAYLNETGWHRKVPSIN